MIRALLERTKRRPPIEESVTILYTINLEACEWSKWSIKLTPKETRLFRKSVKKKRDLLDVLKLDSVLERAEREIMAYEGIEHPPRVIFDDPNYPAVAPNSPEDSIFAFVEDWNVRVKVEKMMLEYEKSSGSA